MNTPFKEHFLPGKVIPRVIRLLYHVIFQCVFFKIFTAMKILKPIVFGVLLGITLFYIPFFLLRVAVVFLIIGGLFRLFRARGWHYCDNYKYVHERRSAFADKIRAMSDEEYYQFKQNQSRFRDFGDEADTGNHS